MIEKMKGDGGGEVMKFPTEKERIGRKIESDGGIGRVNPDGNEKKPHEEEAANDDNY